MNELYLLYINVLDKDWEGNNVFEFIFSDNTDVEDIKGENWDVYPASNEPEPPLETQVKEVGECRTEVELGVIQESDTFCMYDAIDGVIALGWENLSEYEEYPDNRLIFNYGEGIEEVKKKLYSRDLLLNFKFENADTY